MSSFFLQFNFQTETDQPEEPSSPGDVPKTEPEKPKIETQKEVAELRNYFSGFMKETEEPKPEPKTEDKTKGSILKRLAAKFR